ncbi:Membrane protein implicated in regulation of membrane protease activity [Modestobacter sp. DSM 44400]|uniref:NfeD family protein n=1 Tax=Modestobacter sp. DSM 44400 TaxID=1550230 RepID=UPI000899455A|nr:NfeD family protein [Modestobacter sp. DSM 44400]SDX82460.1 Membrane protein implicated in regulation of membrane protease activity [Modestobacter sp. DSM 44400]
MGAWLLWLIAGGLFAAGELASLDLVLLMFAGGALGGMAVALVGLAAPIQIAAFIVVSVGLLVLIRPIAVRHLVNRTPEQIDGVAVYVGRTAVVTERVDHRRGRITMGADVWSARSEYEGQVFEVGEKVRIMELDGPTALVADALE